MRQDVAGRWAAELHSDLSELKEELEARLRDILGSPDLAALLKRGAGAGASPYRVLGVDPGAPDEVVKLVYRYLAHRLHPDHGGSAQAMARLNAAYEEIARERWWK